MKAYLRLFQATKRKGMLQFRLPEKQLPYYKTDTHTPKRAVKNVSEIHTKVTLSTTYHHTEHNDTSET